MYYSHCIQKYSNIAAFACVFIFETLNYRSYVHLEKEKLFYVYSKELNTQMYVLLTQMYLKKVWQDQSI